MEDLKSKAEKVEEAVVMVEMVKKQSIFGYFGENLLNFIKVYVAVPKLIATAKRLIEKNVLSYFSGDACQAFEANIDFDIRFVLFLA